GLAPLRFWVVPARYPVGRVVGQLLVPEPWHGDPPGEPVHVERPGSQVRHGNRRDPGRVADQLPLGYALRRVWPAAEELLVQVREPERAAVHLPRSVIAEVT